MHDDFSALDLLSMGGFRLSSSPKEIVVGKKKRFAGKHRSSGIGAKRGLTALFPILGAKMRHRGKSRLQGWPIALSWPTKEFTTPDLWVDSLDRPAS
ncbi:hypothetical protein [Telmatospirillum sp.]|uniref:hypothetical protein n=1 Tax=Telmatospirillum sp. TaxID=2079197 RepID=UPI00284BEA58|nr:hypothetical protein [Telmatospirillum sp.]MDR3438776.1 hypothetical protein [Telmatospirillum sp.]